MAEDLIDVRGLDKHEGYAITGRAIESLLEGIDDPVAGMATIASVLHHGFGFLWTGFYRTVAPSLLRVGPYQGTVGCLEIPVGRGVCGTAAAERRTVVVPDVSLFPGHIACDARARSEIVVPVFDEQGSVIAVLDIDSEDLNTFDRRDQEGVERIVEWFARLPRRRAVAD
jgi:L-methionine (R)-S-oxide reductase